MYFHNLLDHKVMLWTAHFAPSLKTRTHLIGLISYCYYSDREHTHFYSAKDTGKPLHKEIEKNRYMGRGVRKLWVETNGYAVDTKGIN